LPMFCLLFTLLNWNEQLLMRIILISYRIFCGYLDIWLLLL